MSMETHVFFRGKLPSKAALSRAMKELGFPFSIKPATGSLEQQSGFMPMLLRREETGVELAVFGDHAAVEDFADVGVDQSFERLASFRWGGDYQEAVAGMCAAAALARLVHGVVFDEAEDRLLTVDEAIDLARRCLENLLEPEPEKRPGTRPADIKRYLKPLLKERKDLALIGRLLIIRPVRHLLRGVLLDRTSDKYAFQAWRLVDPLFPAQGYRERIHPTQWEVWQPHFKPFLFDALAEDIFDHVGRITSLVSFASELNPTYLNGHTHFQTTRVGAFALAGERERAIQLVNELEQSEPDDDYWHHWAKGQRKLLERRVDDLCSEFRRNEATGAKELGLGDIWEPAPFPVEVPKAARAARCAEPDFVTSPWVVRPAGLVDEAPEHPGEIRFARDVLWRKGGFVMLVPLTHELAEEMHRTRQDYVLATRLDGGILLFLHHDTHWSPHDPEQPRNPDYVPRRDFRLEAFGSRGRLQVFFRGDFDRPEMVQLQSAEVLDRISGNSIWYAFNGFREMSKSCHDYRGGQRVYEPRVMSAADVDLCEFATPPFGEFRDFWQRTSTYLQNEGFGPFT